MKTQIFTKLKLQKYYSVFYIDWITVLIKKVHKEQSIIIISLLVFQTIFFLNSSIAQTVYQLKDNKDSQEFFKHDGRIATKVRNTFNKVDSITVIDFTSANTNPTNKQVNKNANDFLNYSEFIELSNLGVNKIANKKPQALSVIFEFKGKKITVSLALVDLFTSGFKILSNNPDEVSNITIGTHYQGYINGENSIATFNFFGNEFSGVLSSETEGNINIGKVLSTTTHIVYSDRDMKYTTGSLCETNDNNIQKKFLNSKKIIQNLKNDESLQNLQSLKCITFFWETQYNIYTYLGNAQEVSNFVVSIFNEFNALYQIENIGTKLNNIYIWTSLDPYGEGSTSERLDNFSAMRNGFGANLAHLIGNGGKGGKAQGIGSLCESNEYYRHAFSGNIFNDLVKQIPNYSWPIYVTAHETGHNLGSRHTHACVWNGNNTAIDGCGPTYGPTLIPPVTIQYESLSGVGVGSCSGAPIPSNGGTIMSYCHLGGVGVNFNLGFGQQPGDSIRRVVNSCIANTCDYYNTCTDAFEPNNSHTTANPFFAGPLGTGTSDIERDANIGYQDDVDWFKITLTSCGTLTITLSTLPYNYNVELYGPSGSTQPAIAGSYNTGTQNETINFQSTSATTTTYYIKIYSATPSNFSNASCYNLRMQWASSTCVICTAPAITTHPTNKSVSTPTGTNFSIAASGSNNSCQWQLNTGTGWSNILNNSPYSGAYTTILNISSTTVNMSDYQYRCKVSSSCTTETATSNPATLTVNTSSTTCINDYACSPKSLAISSSCVVTNCTTIGATPPTSDVIYKSCAGTPYLATRYDDDVWFSITPANTNPVTIKVTATSNLNFFDPVLGVYTNGCLSMLQINGGCSDNPPGVPEQITFIPVAGTTYLLRVFSYGMGGAYSGSFDICVTAPGQPNPVADLIIANPQLSVNSLCAGDAVNVSYNIQNIGGLSATASTVKYYLSSDNSYSASDILLESTSVNSINSNASASYNKTLTIPTGTSAGSWYVLVIADANGEINEGSAGESNNLFANSIQINNCSGLADLVINYNSFTPATITPGIGVQVNYTRQNLGTLLASPIQIGVYISADNNFDPNSDEFLNDWTKGSLDAGQTATDILYFAVPNCYQCGTFYIFLVIDYQNIINETNNNNNTSSFPIQISGCVSCSYTVPSTGINFQSAGGSGNLNITTTQCCPWTATTNDSWITLINSSGNGSGAVNYTVGSCSGDGTRTGTITVAGQIHTITQNCVEICNSSQTFDWATRAGSSTLSDAAADLAIDSLGNLYMTGDIQGSANFGNGIILTTPSTAPDIFVSKHNSQGQIQWAVSYGNTGQEEGTAIATDNSGNVYIAGSFINSITFENTTLTSNTPGQGAAFLIKLNPNGILQWAKKMNATNNNDTPTDIVIDKNNNIFIVGDLEYAAQLFVTKYNTDGTQVWYNKYGAINYVKNVFGIAIDNSGNILIAGRYMETITLGSFTLTASNARLDMDGFIAKLDASGLVLWARKLTSPGQGQDELRSIAVDSDNNIYTIGNVDSTAIIENIILPLPDLGSKLIIIKYDQNGNPLWAKASVQGYQYNRSRISITNNDKIYLTGNFYSSVKIDSTVVIGAGDNDNFIARIDENGKILWMKSYGGIQSEENGGLVINRANEIFISGGFNSTVAFGGTTLTSAGSTDIFLAKFKECEVPVANITYNGNLVLCPGQSLNLSTSYCSKNNYQWLLNDLEIPTANNPTYAARQSGVYKVKVAAFPGCETISNPITINSQGLYTFTGTGNWNVATNWENNAMPPTPLPSCYEIIINPIGNTECILNIPQTISPGAKVTVADGKRFKIMGNLIIQ